MVANHHITRVNTMELKDLICRKVGHQRAEKYFDQLKRFFSLKLSKVEFDKSCVQTIGRENVWLHNRLIRSILQNACQAKTPPRQARKVDGLGVKVTNGYQRNCLQSLYGNTFLQSPRKCRSPINRERKFRDCLSPLGPLGKSPSITCEETVTRTLEQQSAAELRSRCSQPPVGVVSVEDGEEVEQFSGGLDVRNWRSVTAPFGVTVNMVDIAHKPQHCGDGYSTCSETCQKSLELPDTITLTSRLEKKLALEGLGISVDCTNLLNKGLDAYLKRLTEPCISIAGSRRTVPHPHGKQSYNQRLSGSIPQSKPTNTLDFRVALDSNPFILGEDWSMQLEKISLYASQ